MPEKKQRSTLFSVETDKEKTPHFKSAVRLNGDYFSVKQSLCQV